MAERILVHRVGQLGDLVCAVPALVAIRRRFPDAGIALLTSPVRRGMVEAHAVLEGAGHVDEIIRYYASEMRSPVAVGRFVRKLRRRRFTCFVELGQVSAPRWRGIREWAFARLIGARRVVGIAEALGRRRGRDGRDEVTRLLDIVAAAGMAERSPGVEFRIPSDAATRRLVDRFQQRAGDPGRPWVALNPGAKRQANRWPEERFAAVGRALARRGAQIAVTGAASELALCDWVAEQIGPGATVAAGQGDLRFAAELLGRCRLLVTNDTGTMHLAAAVGTPCVVAGTARDVPGRWAPWGPGHQVIRKDVPCSPCFRETCDHISCLRSIDVAEVVAAATRVLHLRGAAGDAASPAAHAGAR
jgi:lipopolysaccharide heptosyltransferase II